MQGSLRCLAGRGAGGIVRRRERNSLPSLETLWLRGLARPARVERRRAWQGCRRCCALSEERAAQLDVRRLLLGSRPCNRPMTCDLRRCCHWAGPCGASAGAGAGSYG